MSGIKTENVYGTKKGGRRRGRVYKVFGKRLEITKKGGSKWGSKE